MAGFGDVLRRLGSVLNPQVAQELAQEERAKEAQSQQMGMFALQNLVQDKRFKEEMAFKEKENAANRALAESKATEDRAARVLQFDQNLEVRREQLTYQRDNALRAAKTAEEKAATDKWYKEQSLRLEQQGLDIKRQLAGGEGQGKPPSGYRWKANQPGILEPIPGGPATVQSPEQAAKTELLANGIKDVGRYRELVMKDGKIDRQIILGMATPGMAGVPGTDSRLAYSYIYNAIEAKLRAESGAAVPETEVTRMAKRFVPSPLDNDETIKSKVDRLEEFLGGSLGRVKGEPGAGVRQPSVEDLLKKYGGS